MPIHQHYITADAIVFDKSSHRVLLIKRRNNPFQGHWALPGGHLDPEDPSILHAAARELLEETGLKIELDRFSLVGYWDRVKRDPRGRYVSFAFLAELPSSPLVSGEDDAIEAAWVPVQEAMNMSLAFDHNDMLLTAFGGQK